MTAERVGGLLLAALAPLVLLTLDPGGWYPFGPAKVLVLTMVGGAGAVLVVGTRRPSVPRSLALALGALVIAMAIAAVTGEEGLYAWVGTPERRFGVLTWVLCAGLLLAGRALGAGGWPPLGTGLLVAGLGVGGVATAEALGWEPDVLDAGSRLTGTLGSAAYLGAAAALLLPVMVGFAVDRSRDRRRRGSSSAAALLLAVAVAGSGTRAAWVGLAVASAVTALARRDAVIAVLRADRRRSRLGGIGAAVVVAAVLLLTPVGARIGALADDGAPGGRGRVDEWAVAARVVTDHPVFGVGPEGYRVAFPSEVDEGYQRAHGRDQMPDRAHSGPLDIALAGGALGLAAWLAVVVIVGRSVWRALRDGPPWLTGIAAGLVAHVVTQLFFFPVAELEPIAWLLAGVLTTATTAIGAATRTSNLGVLSTETGGQRPQLRNPDSNLGASPTETGGQHPQVRNPDSNLGASPTENGGQRPQVGEADRMDARRPSRWVVGLAAVVAAAALIAGVTDLVADHHATRAADALARGDGRDAAEAAEAAVDTRGDILRLHLLAAEAALLDQQGTVAALRHVDAALDLSPGDPIALRTKAQLLVDRAGSTGLPAHRDEAAAFVDGRLRDDPYEPQLWRLRATLAALEGDDAARDDALERAAELTPTRGS